MTEPTQIEFREFRYNPINPKTGKASFAAVLNHEGKDYYLEGTIPDVDKKGHKINATKLILRISSLARESPPSTI
jgi:hypothetical protein